MKIVATKVLLTEYPELAKAGLRVGDDLHVKFKAAKKPHENNPETLDEDEPPPTDDGTGGSHPSGPPGKP